jgi:hypothetical protein
MVRRFTLSYTGMSAHEPELTSMVLMCASGPRRDALESRHDARVHPQHGYCTAIARRRTRGHGPGCTLHACRLDYAVPCGCSLAAVEVEL